MQDLDELAYELLDGIKLKDSNGGEALGAWFLGVKGENACLFEDLIVQAVRHHVSERKNIYPEDPPWITERVTNDPDYTQAVAVLQQQFNKLLDMLEYSVPFFSYRYQGHMLWDLTLPSVLGYFAAMLYNQNNVAAEASPVTTLLEMEVGDDLCRMLGYHVTDRTFDKTRGICCQPSTHQEPRAWGHITCDGTVANVESMWVARNLKFYPLAVAQALVNEPVLKSAQGLDVALPGGDCKKLVELDSWELLNIKVDDILALPGRLEKEYGLAKDAVEVIENYTLQTLGFAQLQQRYPAVSDSLAILCPATSHYSWPKSAAMLGIGRNQVIKIRVDLDGRMEIAHLRSVLDQCLADHKPVAMVIGVLGTTEESAVDPVEEIVTAREDYRRKGLEFFLHIDAAWGGYFASLLREPSAQSVAAEIKLQTTAQGCAQTLQQHPSLRVFTPELAMSDYVTRQYIAIKHADSITVDPHKAGYIPYPAGGLCYRNSAMRNMVTFTAPVVYHGGIDPSVGVYGVEGSKPGAAAAATYLSHRVIRTDQSGYGRILGRCLFNSKRLYAALVAMAQDTDDFIVVPFQRLPMEKDGGTARQVEEQRAHIAKTFTGHDNESLWKHLENNREDLKLFRDMGSDQLIIAYAFNFKENGCLNRDVDRMNTFNDELFKRMSIREYKKRQIQIKTGDKSQAKPQVPLIVTSSSFQPEDYGPALVENYMARLGVQVEKDKPLNFLISTTMDPWLTDTAQGNFIPHLIAELRKEVEAVILQLTDPERK